MEAESEPLQSIYSTAFDKIFIYNMCTGDLIWRITTGPRSVKGNKAGWVHGGGYVNVNLGGEIYPVHKVIWFMTFGEWTLVDHEDRNKANNRLINLRKATQSQNAHNKGTYTNNRLGVKGVRRMGKKYEARIQCEGKPHHLGMFNTLEEAKAAYEQAATDLFGEFACLEDKRDRA